MTDILKETVSVEVRHTTGRQGFLFIFQGEGKPGVIKELQIQDFNDQMINYILELAAEEMRGLSKTEISLLKSEIIRQSAVLQSVTIA